MPDFVTLFCPGARLVLHLPASPTLDAWEAHASRLGIPFTADQPLPTTAGRTPFRALATIEHWVEWYELARVGTFSLSFELELEEAEGVDVALEDVGPRELAVLRRAQWKVTIWLEPDQPDLLPSALAVALAAAYGGVVHHSGLDRSVFGNDASAMISLLHWYSDHLDAPSFDDVAEKCPAIFLEDLAERVADVVNARRRTSLDPEDVAPLLEQVTLEHHARLEAADPPERWETLKGLYLEHLHVWLQGELRDTSSPRDSEWQELMQELEQVLAQTWPAALAVGSFEPYRVISICASSVRIRAQRALDREKIRSLLADWQSAKVGAWEVFAAKQRGPLRLPASAPSDYRAWCDVTELPHDSLVLGSHELFIIGAISNSPHGETLYSVVSAMLEQGDCTAQLSFMPERPAQLGEIFRVRQVTMTPEPCTGLSGEEIWLAPLEGQFDVASIHDYLMGFPLAREGTDFRGSPVIVLCEDEYAAERVESGDLPYDAIVELQPRSIALTLICKEPGQHRIRVFVDWLLERYACSASNDYGGCWPRGVTADHLLPRAPASTPRPVPSFASVAGPDDHRALRQLESEDLALWQQGLAHFRNASGEVKAALCRGSSAKRRLYLGQELKRLPHGTLTALALLPLANSSCAEQTELHIDWPLDHDLEFDLRAWKALRALSIATGAHDQLPTFVYALRQLEHLVVHYSDLERLDVELTRLTELRTLSFPGCHFITGDAWREALPSLERLSSLSRLGVEDELPDDVRERLEARGVNVGAAWELDELPDDDSDARDDDDDDSDDLEWVPPSLKLAREVLELGQDASPESVKRAYLRQVKRHRPERDPEGFQRVRAAYDRLRDSPSRRQDRPPVRLVRREAPHVDRLVEHAPPSPTDPIAPFFERAGKLRRNDPTRVEVWREAVSVQPKSIVARQELYAALMGNELEEEAAQTLIDAVRGGLEGFERLLVMAHGAAAPDDVVERAAANDDLGAAVLEAWVDKEEWERAAETAIRELDRAIRSSDVRVSLGDCILSLFGLAKMGAKAKAAALAESMAKYVTHAPKELHASGLGAHWALAHELAESLPWLERDVRKGMAIALLTEEVAMGRQDLSELLAERPRERARIARRAPLLAALFDISGPPEPGAPIEPATETPDDDDDAPGEGRSMGATTWLIGLVAVALLLLAVFAPRQRERPAFDPPDDYLPSSVTEEPDDLDIGDAAPAALRDAAQELIDFAEQTHRPRVARLARGIVRAVSKKDCDTAHDKMRLLLEATLPTVPRNGGRISELSLALLDAAKGACH